jgi:hypothetical protein
MPDSPTLSTAPFEHLALDYAFLRREGIRHLESLAGQLWTDFNMHDPGITILEQLCYAITDLAYRASYDVPDLLAASGGDPYRSLYGASTILTSHPITLLDLRKLIIDVDGVNNAWIEEVTEPRPAFHFQDDKHELGFQADPPYTTPVRRRGIARVLIERADRVDLGDRSDLEIQRDVARRLFACRPLCTDFDGIQVLAGQPIQVYAEVEIGTVDDAESVLLAIYQALWEHVSPSVRFLTLAEMLAAGKRSDEIFDGPALDHGFLDSEALEALHRRDAIHTSDLIREIMSTPGVRAVRSIAVSADGGRPERWSLSLDAGRTPRLDLQDTSIVLMKGRLAARLDVSRIIDALIERREPAARNQRSLGDQDFALPAGRDRSVARYRSIQHQFPAIYGIGPAGLPDSAPDRRRAQAKQLKAYLLFFDQLLASYFAQLSRTGSLFSFYEQDVRTYFTQMVDDDALGLSDIRMFDDATHLQHLQHLAEDEDSAATLSSRKNRFLNHLMARFAEQFTDYSLVLLGTASRDPRPDRDRIVSDKQAFLQHYPRISSARGTGGDILSRADEDGVSGLEERIQRRLGLSVEDGERMFLIEHVLLAPMSEDNIPPGRLDRQLPLLADAVSRDPYSLQLSVVFPNWRGRLQQGADGVHELRMLVEHTVREETPAHLTPFVHWLDETRWPLFESAYEAWRDAYRRYRAMKLGLEPMGDPRHLCVRDTRDRLIDLLGLGQTYPLRDLPVGDDQLTVPLDQPAKIPIELSQRGVIYELCGDGDAPLATAEGTGETIFLQTPPMQMDTTFRILARKLATAREAYLLEQATVKVGLDEKLRARILDAELLDPSVKSPTDEAARIVAWGTPVRVQIDHSQEGVDYHLLQIVDGDERRLSADVRGNLGDIVLSGQPADEDLDLRIRATKQFDPSEHQETQSDLLEIALPLKVRARPDLAVALEPSSLIDFDADATVRIDSTQANTAYSLYVRAVSDRDFVFDTAVPGLLAADVDGEPRVYVVRPPQPSTWEELNGFQPVGAPVQGNGGTLRLPLSALRDDSVILIRAQKNHQLGAASIASSAQLAQAALLLVRPDPQPALEVGVVMDGGQTDGTLEITGGQAGVFYQVRRDPDGPTLGLPAYFHKTDERDAAANKGIGADHTYGIRIEVDLVISRGTQWTATTPAELAATPPLPPLLSTEPLDAGTTLHFRAIKAQTRAAARLSRTARIASVPRILAAPTAVPSGGTTTIVVRASVAGDRYQLVQDGQPVGPARDGDGGDLVFMTAPVSPATRFQVLVTRPVEPGIPVRRTVRVKPTPPTLR